MKHILTLLMLSGLNLRSGLSNSKPIVARPKLSISVELLNSVNNAVISSDTATYLPDEKNSYQCNKTLLTPSNAARYIALSNVMIDLDTQSAEVKHTIKTHENDPEMTHLTLIAFNEKVRKNYGSELVLIVTASIIPDSITQ